MAELEYQRLTRTVSRSLFSLAFHSRSSLWLAKDHLLVIDSTGYSESYKRFYFRDIQALTFRLSKRRSNWNWGYGIIAGMFTIASVRALVMGVGTAETVIVSVVAALAITGLVINNLLGPTCVSTLKTAVQQEELPFFRRLRKAERILDRLRPMIAAAQGANTREEIAARLASANLPAELVPAQNNPLEEVEPPPRIAP